MNPFLEKNRGNNTMAERDPESDGISLLSNAKSPAQYASSQKTESFDHKRLSNSAMGCFAICALVFGAMTLIDLSSGVLFQLLRDRQLALYLLQSFNTS